MHYGKINGVDIANGDGVRVSIFVSGCRNRCPGCFNKQAWDFSYGELFTTRTMQKLDELLSREYISGLTVLGGDPFEPENINTVANICGLVKTAHPNKNVWVYTGYKYEDIKDKGLMDYIDVLVDGPFIESQKDITLKYKGSSNQRIIDVKKSKELGKVMLYYD